MVVDYKRLKRYQIFVSIETDSEETTRYMMKRPSVIKWAGKNKRQKEDSIWRPFGHTNWNNMPSEILSDILMKVGLVSMDDLRKCRQVCQNWNRVISEMTKHQVDLLRRNEAENLRHWWVNFPYFPSYEEISRAKYLVKSGHLAKSVIATLILRVKRECIGVPSLREIKTAASLAHHGLIVGEFCDELRLKNVDLSSVPEDHFASLTSKVRNVKIQNVISPKLSGLRCPYLEISDQVLNTEETLALKKAMKFLRFLVLGAEGNVFLDIQALTKYDEKGSIHDVTISLCNATARRYRIFFRVGSGAECRIGYWNIQAEAVQ